MTNFNENAIKEAAYYIWKNNGCPANSSLQDWNDAINQLSAMAALSNVRSSLKTASIKSLSLSAASVKKTSSAKKTSAAAKKTTTAKKSAKKSK